ncbi:AsmA family protein [Kaarinaea lacus]
MRRIILIGVFSLVSLILIVFISLFAYLQFADLNRFKPQISQRLSTYLNRSVVIDGPFDINLIPLGLSLTDAKIANASWGTQPEMLRVHQLDLQLGLLALISGELIIHKFILDDVQILVEHNEQGENNWRIREPGKRQEKTAVESSTIPLDFVSDVEIDIRNITLSYRESPTLPHHDFVLNKATLKGLSDLDALQIDVSGQFDGHVYQVAGQTGRLAELLSVNKRFPVDLQAKAFNTDWAIKGDVLNALKLENIQLNVQASAKDFTAWQESLGVSIKSGPVNINADIAGNLNKLTVKNLAVQLAKTMVTGNVAVDMSTEKPDISAQLNMQDIHIKEFLGAFQAEPTKKNKSASQEVNLNPFEEPLDLEFLSLFDASVQFSVNTVGYDEWIIDQFNAAIAVKNGQFSISPFSIASPLGQATGKFSLLNEQGINVAKLDIDAKELALGKFYDMASTYQGIGALQGSLHTKGKSLSNLYANLQGNATAHYANSAHKHTTQIVLQRTNPANSAAPFAVAIDGELQKVPYKITGEIGGPQALISDNPYPLTAQLSFLNVDTKARGTIAELFEAKGFDIKVDARTSHLATLEKTLDIGLPALKKAQVKTVFRGDYSLLKFDHIRVKGSNARLSGNVHIDFEKKLPYIFGNINIDELDLAGIQKEIARVNKAERVKRDKDAKDQKAILAETMSFSALQDFNMNIKLKARDGSLNIPNFSIDKAAAELRVENSALSVWHVNIDSPAGNIKSHFKINAKEKIPVVDARLKSDELDLEKIELENGEQFFWKALASADVSLHTQGDSLEQWLKSVVGNITLNYEHKQLEQIHAIQLAREASQNVADAPVAVRLNSKYKDTLFLGLGSISDPYTWAARDEPTSFDLKANIKGFVTEVQGKIDDLISGKGMDIQLSVNNLQALDPSLSQNDFVNRVGKVQVTSEIKGDYTSIVASRLDGVIGQGRITGSTSINMQQQPVMMEFDWNIDGLDISKWAEDDTTTAKKQDKTSKQFSSEELPFDLLKEANLKGRINGKNIQFRRVKALEVKATVDLKDGALKFDLDRLTAADGSLNANLEIDSKAEPPRVSVQMNVPKINMSEIARNTAAEGLVRGYFGAEVSVSSTGNSTAELVAGLDGHVRFLIDEGTIDSALFDIYTGGLRAMVGMMTIKKERTTKINCGICGLTFDKGKGVTEVALLDTKHSTLVAEGWVDFNNETFSLKASPVSKGIPLNMELPVIIEGPFSNPRFTTETTSALYKAAEIATVWIVPGTLVFIGYDGLRSSDNNPCVNMVAPSRDRIGMRAIKGAGKAVKDVGSAFNKSLSRLLGGGSGSGAKEEGDVGANDE